MALTGVYVNNNVPPHVNLIRNGSGTEGELLTRKVSANKGNKDRELIDLN